MGCGRGYGRRRSPSVEGEALWDCDELVVCDQCWHLAGGTAAITTRLTGAAMEPAIVFDPVVEALLAGAAEYDELHPIDRLLVESGVRWAVLRHIAVPARMQLAGQVLRRPAPEATRSADSARIWLDAVEDRIRAQTGAGASTGAFVYNAKRRRWWRIANLLACAADRDTRPLTWVTQEEIAAVVGCSTRTVRRAVAWLRAEGLLWEVVPGCRLPQQHVPDAETATEAADRRARLAAAVAAEEAAIARARAHLVLARAELDAVDDGHIGAAAAVAAQLALPDDVITALALDPATEPDPALVNLSPVYELRVPAEPDPLPTPARPAPAADPLTSENTDRPDPADEFVHPPQVSNQDPLKSISVQDVDKRRAPRGPYEESSGGSRWCTASPATLSGADPAGSGPAPRAVGDTSSRPQSQAVQVAQWLLRSTLDIRLCEDVSVRWLAGQIRSSQLLDRYGWTRDDLLDLIHGQPEHPNLPRHIRNPRGWIRARLTSASPALPPSKLRHVLRIERSSEFFRGRAQAERAAEQRAEIAAQRAAIAACKLCDELGWLHVARDTPTARCNHDPSAGGW
ncbi:helix-turn-helix domain-containing protein [Pseudonocardia sichuanensis]